MTELLLPILVFKSPLFAADSEDEIVKIAEVRQYKCIEDALLAGFESPKWLACMSELAGALIDALTRAEDALARSASVADPEVNGDPDRRSSPPQVKAGEEDDEGGGLAEHMIAMQAAVEEMTEAAQDLPPTMEAFNSAMEEIGDFPESPKQMQVWATRLAHALKDPSLDLQRHGQQMFAAATRLDEALTGIKRLAVELDNPEVSGPLEEGLTEVVRSFGDLTEVQETMESLLIAMKPAEVLSVPLRKSLRPARRGVTSVRDTLQLVASWRTLVNDL